MITIGTVDNMNPSLYDENWMIVRAPDEIPSYAKHVPLLSPLPSLFDRYRTARDAGLFNQEWFDKEYVPEFLRDLSRNKEAQNILKKLCREKRNLYLCCYCTVESMCHRSIIAGILLGMGADIDTKEEYRKYYDLLKALQNKEQEVL